MTSRTPLKAYLKAYLAVVPNDADVTKEIDELMAVVNASKPLRSFVGDRSVAATERRKALDIALPRLSDETKNLAIALADDGRMKDLPRLPGLTRKMNAERSGRRHAVVTSATPLQAGELARVSSALERVARTPVTLEERMDESLIAGFSVALGDWTFDASLKGKLNRLSHALTL
ncbi:ATP synthase F1 subunit delta [Candidatus Uhrbacteria bacterium RIFCSPHIGHO2_12_FULL_60_25]|uniref:ATP synthase subunit delta n=1 Tax=Candidatus Uhrbacteria bacterium RIFCSPHIGHO2_12_FULL_60_25 TaxID=1802399 RepID=A0A1F7UII4_9BACT|nr:MAG: ATP synthase F1 subunit delta [Candidatus Uhrbacteria bacterium RIFCSPHIGHO2_02_FULL_60_44]OGL78100.1 MAG: ATP synthase F1 subunit delta [Candidatus Uhrbacteria bacterium RIFCSPHIGHO2_12_FULL_60_25]